MIILLILSLSLALAPVVSAADLDLVTDLAGVLTSSQVQTLNARAERISDRYRCDVAIVVIDEMTDNDGAYEWARYVYREFDFGYGSDKSGVIFFLSVDDRDFALVAFGYGNTAFTDYGKDVLLDEHILPLLRNDRYFDAFSAYLDVAEDYLRQARDGTPFDRPDSSSIFIKLAITILLPLLIAFIVCSMWKGQMKTAVRATTACNYIPQGGFNLTANTDMFLYTTRTVVRVQQQSSGSSSRGGTSVDSKGFSGRSGKF